MRPMCSHSHLVYGGNLETHRAQSVKSLKKKHMKEKDQLLTGPECVQPRPLLPVEGFIGTPSLSSLKRMGLRCRTLQQSLPSLASAAEIQDNSGSPAAQVQKRTLTWCSPPLVFYRHGYHFNTGLKTSSPGSALIFVRTSFSIWSVRSEIKLIGWSVWLKIQKAELLWLIQSNRM